MNASNSPFDTASAVTMGVPVTSAPLKIALLLLTGISAHLSLTPPNSAAPKTILVKKTLFERGILWVTFCSKTMVWLMTLSDALATYLDAYTSYSLACPRAVAHFPASTNSLLSASPLLIVGALAVFLGCLLRKWCFRKLGTLFTFELTIHPDHRLITTGPYSVVRHPSYTGIYLTLLGSTAVGLASGSYLRECWLGVGCSGQTSWAGTPGPDATDAGLLTLPSLGQVLVFSLVTFWLAKVCFALRSTNKRLAIEDAELHKIFGEVWEEYENSVRWKLVPGVY